MRSSLTCTRTDSSTICSPEPAGTGTGVSFPFADLTKVWRLSASTRTMARVAATSGALPTGADLGSGTISTTVPSDAEFACGPQVSRCKGSFGSGLNVNPTFFVLTALTCTSTLPNAPGQRALHVGVVAGADATATARLAKPQPASVSVELGADTP